MNLDCSDGKYELINPVKNKLIVKDCEEFGDNWSDELQTSDIQTIDNYFKRKEKIRSDISFINLRVGGER